MTMLEIALCCIRRGWFVHPLHNPTAHGCSCGRRDCPSVGKHPRTEHGKDDATLDEAQVRAWWAAAKWPNANVGISCAPSGLLVLDADHGLTSMEDFIAWRDRNGLPVTYAVRSGRRPEFGVQSYYAGSQKDGKFELDGVRGDIKSAGGLVLAAGSVHPSGETYTVIVDAHLAPAPVDTIERHRVKPVNLADGDAPIRENRNMALTSIAGKLRNAGCSPAALEAALLQINSDRCEEPLEEEEVKKIAASVSRYALPEPEIEVTIGQPELPKVPADPLSFFDTVDSILNAPPVEHIIQGILPRNRYTGVVALAGARKTILAWNIARSCLTLEPFMGRFPVVSAPSRVLLLLAESSPNEIKEKLEQMALVSFARGGKLIIRSAANETDFHQDWLPDDFVKDTLIVFDTFARFFDGQDEQSATDTKTFTKQMQRLVNAGATVVTLFHAPKNAKGSELSIESIRGSGELGAGMACAWGLSMLGDRWEDNTRMSQVKKRSFQCEPPEFDFSCDIPTAICSYVGEATIGKRGPKKSAETLAKDAAAEAFILEHFDTPHRTLARELEALGIKRDEKWVRNAKLRLRPSVTVTEGAAAD